MAEIKLQTITITENTVVLSLKRYNELIKSERYLSETAVYVKNGWLNSVVYTSNDVAKQLAIDMQKSINEADTLSAEIDHLKKEIEELKNKRQKSTKLYIRVKNAIGRLL